MSKVSNVLDMLQYLSNGHKYKIAELAEKLEVSPRMIRIYKDELEKAGIYIETIKGPYGGYVLRQNVTIPQRFINPKPIDLNSKKIYNKLEKAIKQKQKCYIEYYSKNKKSLSKRIIHPYNLLLLGNEWGIAAYCENKNEIRHFYLNRIRSIKELKEIYK